MDRQEIAMIKNFLLASMIVILVSACGPVSSVPQAWFDQPLNGASFPLAPVEITMHATDPGGISQVQLFVNGEAAESITNQNASSKLAIITTVWVPVAPGEYTLQVRAQSSAGTWSEFATTIVFIGDLRSGDQALEPTSDLVDQPSPTWTPTSGDESPTSTYTMTLRPVPTSTPTYVRPTSTLTPTYFRPSFTPTATGRILSPTATCYSRIGCP
jgi:hypothetical protein